MRARLILTRSVALRVVISVAGMGLTSCGDRQESARAELHSKDFTFTVEDYMRAAQEGNVPALEKFLDAGMNVNVADAESTQALFRAAQFGQAGATRLLIQRGADLNAAGAGWDTPLIAASRGGHLEVVQALLEAGADVNRRSERNWTALTAAAYAGHTAIVEVLAPHSQPSVDEALQIASLTGSTPVMGALLKAGASVFSRSKDNKTPLMFAAMNGHIDAVKLLMMHGANRFALDSRDRTAADLALAQNHGEVAAFLNDPQLPAGAEEMMAETGVEPLTAPQDSLDGAAVAAAPDSSASGPASHSDRPTEEAGPAAAMASGPDGPSDPAGRGGPTLETRRAGAAFAHSGTLSRRPSAPSIQGTHLDEVPTGDGAAVQQTLAMDGYREAQLPIVLESVPSAQAAHIRVLYRTRNATEAVTPGEMIADTGLELVKIEQKYRASKTGEGELIDVSRAVVRDAVTGQRHLVVKDMPARASEACATLRCGTSGTSYEVREGDEFSAGAESPARYRVLDVRPTQVVIENTATGEPVTLRRGRSLH